MIQLICHLIGDYALQSHVMATRKTSSLTWALIHAAFYTLPFLLLTRSFEALAVICLTHALIDRFAVARRWCEFYGVGFPGAWDRLTHEVALYAHLWPSTEPWFVEKSYVRAPFVAPPPFLGVWLIIIVDNTMHLAINYAALWAFP